MSDTAAGKKSSSLIRVRLESRHDAFLTEPHVQVSKDGENILCQCGEKINVLSCATGQVVHALEAKDDPLYTMKLSPNGELLVASHTSGLLRLWDWRNNEVQRVWKSLHTGPIPTLGFDETTTLVASGGVDGTVKVWDIVRQYCTHSLKGSVGVVSAIQFYQRGSEFFLYASGDDAVIRCWNLASSEVTQELRGHFSKVTSLSVDAARQQLVSCGRDKVLMLWDLRDGSLVRTVATHEAMEGAVLVPPGRAVAEVDCGEAAHAVTAGERGVLRLWNLASSECVFTQTESSSAPSSVLCQVEYTERTDTITVVNHEHNVLMYDARTLELRRQYVGFSDEILDVVFCGPEETHLAVATNSAVVKVYDVSSFSCRLVTGHSDTVLSLAVCPANRSLFASCSKDNTVRVWRLDAAGGAACLAVGAGHTASVTSVCWSQLSAAFVVTGAEDKCVKVWDVPAGRPDAAPEQPAGLHCRRTEIAHDKDVNCVAVSPNDRLIATASQDRTARLYAADGLALSGVMRGHRRGVWWVAFSPVDQVAATASADCTVRLWSIADCSCVKTLEGHDSSVLRAAFLRRGMQLATCSADGLLKLWSVKANECVQTCSEHEAKVWTLAVRADESRLVSGGADSSLLVWRDVSEEEARAETEAAALRVSQEQALSNLVQQKQWLRALKLAITLKRPFRCLQVLKELRREAGSADRLGAILTQLRDDQLDELLLFAVEWNTNSRHCHEAQLVVSLLLRLRPPDAWRRLPSCRAILEGLLPYTERHLDRMTRLLQSVSFLDYTAACMKVTARPGAAQPADTDRELFADPAPDPVAAGTEVKRESSDTEDTPGAEDAEEDTAGTEDAEEDTAGIQRGGESDRVGSGGGADAGQRVEGSDPSEDSGLETEPVKKPKPVKKKRPLSKKTKKSGKKRKV